MNLILIPLGIIAGALVGLLARGAGDGSGATAKAAALPTPPAPAAPAASSTPKASQPADAPAPAAGRTRAGDATEPLKVKAPPPAKRDDQTFTPKWGWGGTPTEAKTEPKDEPKPQPRTIAEPKKRADDATDTATSTSAQAAGFDGADAFELGELAGAGDGFDGADAFERAELAGAGDDVFDAFTSTLAKVPLFGLAAAPIQAAKVGIDKATGHDPKAAEKAAAKAAAAKKHKKGDATCKPCEKRAAAAQEAAQRAGKVQRALMERIKEWNAERPHWPWSRVPESNPSA